MNRRPTWLLLVLFLGALALFALSRVARVKNESPSQLDPAVESNSPTNTSNSLGKDTALNPQPAQTPAPQTVVTAAPLKAKMPQREDYLDQVDENPHGVPQAIRDFARELAPRMRLALTDSAQATALLPELARCGQEAELQTVRIQCLANAKRIGDRWPDLKARAEADRENAKAEDRERLRLLGL